MRQTPNFDRIAPLYRWLEYLTLGRTLERTRTHHLPALALSRQALLLGDGDGRFTAALLARYPALHAHAVDLSPRMLQLLENRTHSPQLRTTAADALTLTPHPAPDLIVTHFFLDCLTQPQTDTLVPHLAAHSTPAALWLTSEFAIPAGPLRYPARLYIRALYLAFRILTGLRVTRIPNYAIPLQQAGFLPIATATYLRGLLITTLWQRQPSKLNMEPAMTHDPATDDPQPDPEPASPSLDTPDPAVYHPTPPPAQN